jgi:rhodanese-related sulfurtransferase
MLTIKKITAEELYEKLKREEKVFLLDVRAEEKFADFHIEAPGFETRNVPKTFILEGGEGITSIPANEEVVVTCTTGNSATKCANVLAEKDYNVVVLEGGITAWKEFLKNK